MKVIKKSLSSDGQQFHQYQQNDLAPQINEHRKIRLWQVTLEIKVLAWDMHKNVTNPPPL